MPAVLVWMVSSWSNIDPDCQGSGHADAIQLLLDSIIRLFFCPNCINFLTKIGRVFLLDGAAEQIRMEIYIVCSHVGQMFFADNK
jgi:hypothetical protein